jgi:hypothetical protein
VLRSLYDQNLRHHDECPSSQKINPSSNNPLPRSSIHSPRIPNHLSIYTISTQTCADQSSNTLHKDPDLASSDIMAPKQAQLRVASTQRRGNKGYFGEAYSAITSPENATVVRSVAVFGVCIFSHSEEWNGVWKGFKGKGMV